jgi:hypothetical protein
MIRWLRDRWRGYTDADMDTVNRWAANGLRPVPARMTSGEYWAQIARWDRQR